MKKQVTGILLAAVIFTAFSCKSTKEVKGPLLTDFSKIDTNSDGFISVQELEKAPKPSGQRSQQGPPSGRN